MQETPSSDEIQEAIDIGRMVASTSRETRARFRRRHTPKRQEALERAVRRCAEAAKPLRSYIGMVAWHDLSDDVYLAMRKVMEELRYERRQISKML